MSTVVPDIVRSDEVTRANNKIEQKSRIFQEYVQLIAGSFMRIWPTVGNHTLSPTGEEYIEIVSGAIIRPGQTDSEISPNWLWPTDDQAITAWFDTACQYARAKAQKYGRSAVLYWRILPEIDVLRGEWKTYSRLLISGKPAIMPAKFDDDEMSFRFPNPNQQEARQCPTLTANTETTT